MSGAENRHYRRSGDIARPNRGKQIIKHGENRKRDRNEKKRFSKQGDIPPGHEIPHPDDIIKQKEQRGCKSPPAFYAIRLFAHKKCHRGKISNAADALCRFQPPRDIL